MHSRERRTTILRALAERGFASVQQLEQRTSASPATIRRDLAGLERAGQLRRVRGGAEAVADGLPPNLAGQPAFFATQARCLAQKRAIARRAAELIAPGSSIIVDGGTTTFALVEFLRDRDVRVLTPSFPLANELLQQTRARVMVPGGLLYREQQIVLSPFDEPVIGGTAASLLFMGAQAVSERGLLQSDPMLIQAQRNLLDRAERLVVLADSSKFDPGAEGDLMVCPLRRVDTLISDSALPQAARILLDRTGVEFLAAEA